MTSRVIVLAALAACGHPSQPSVPTNGAAPVTQNTFPNVHARMRIAQTQPGVTPRGGELEIWMTGSKFRVRDSSGRGLGEMLADLEAPRGLGQPARTMEEIMDRKSAATDPKGPPIELFGDVANDQGWIYEPGRARAELSAKELAVIAEQILARDKTTGLTPHGTATRAGRKATEYTGVLPVTEDGKQFQNQVTRVVAAPFLLFEHLNDATNAGLSYEREVLAIEEGSVRDADVAPP
jgi:hypothetical protein